MNIALKSMTVDRYLAWLEEQPRGRFELVDGQVIPMNAQRIEHVRTKVFVVIALMNALKGTSFHAVGDGMAVRIDQTSAYEPDALVYGGDELKDGTVLVNEPILVVEILSPGTKTVDTTTKLKGYFGLPSVRHYLVIDPVKKTVVHHARDQHGQIATTVQDEGHLALVALGVTLPVGAFFKQA